MAARLLPLAAALVLISLTWANDHSILAGLHGAQADAPAATRRAERSLHNAEAVTAMGMSQSNFASRAHVCKPCEANFLLAMECHGIEAAGMLFIDDHSDDIVTAKGWG